MIVIRSQMESKRRFILVVVATQPVFQCAKKGRKHEEDSIIMPYIHSKLVMRS